MQQAFRKILPKRKLRLWIAKIFPLRRKPLTKLCCSLANSLSMDREDFSALQKATHEAPLFVG
ncbi:hypothetical protein EFP84_02450 [Leptospira kmetyi]|uniref:Uncharacterized protein n=1 Tax=Leptospira kmetyi TaxID=408139 RepID=A0AAD0UQT1_9LEPT|nr:hypothetical protein EFP84_02450 [Leptospira kmetyi]